MQSIKTVLFTGWHFGRWLRLALGLFVGIQSIRTQDGFAGAIAAFLLFQALSATGCCATSGCAPASKGPGQRKTEEVEFEEVKMK